MMVCFLHSDSPGFKFPVLRNFYPGVLGVVWHVLIGSEEVVVTLSENVVAVPDVQTPLRPVQVCHKPEDRTCHAPVLVLSLGLMGHYSHIQGPGVASVGCLPLPDLLQARNVAERNRFVCRQVDLPPFVL